MAVFFWGCVCFFVFFFTQHNVKDVTKLQAKKYTALISEHKTQQNRCVSGGDGGGGGGAVGGMTANHDAFPLSVQPQISARRIGQHYHSETAVDGRCLEEFTLLPNAVTRTCCE